jgi:hypothetical protein
VSVKLLRETIQTILTEASSLTDFEISVEPPNTINVRNKVTGGSGSSRKIQVEAEIDAILGTTTALLKVDELRIKAFNPTAPDGQPVLSVYVKVSKIGVSKESDADIINKSALLGLANAVINGTSYTAPWSAKKNGMRVRLIVNGKS